MLEFQFLYRNPPSQIAGTEERESDQTFKNSLPSHSHIPRVSTNLLASSDTDVVDDEGAEPKKGDRHSDYNTLTGPLKPNMASSEENVRNELKTTAHANEGKSKMEAICIDWTVRNLPPT